MTLKTVWDEVMLASFRQLRKEGQPLYLCAEKIGVSYQTMVYKARELNLAGRLNRGRITGPDNIARQP